MSISVKESGICNKDSFPRFFEFRSEGSDVLVNHVFIIAGIIKEKAEGIIWFKELFWLKEIAGFNPFAEASHICVFCGIPSNFPQYTTDLYFRFGSCSWLELIEPPCAFFILPCFCKASVCGCIWSCHLQIL